MILLNSNLKKGMYKKGELKLYELSNIEIDIILEYQQKLPILQQDNTNWIEARTLHLEMKVNSIFANWIKQQIEDLEAEEGIDYKLTFSFKGKRKNVKVNDYQISVDFAKDIAMTAGSKGGRTNEELKRMSKLVRKYFKVMEKAAQYRIGWNKDRTQSIAMFHGLTEQLKINESNILPYIPQWWKKYYNVYSYEMDLLNQIIIGMKSKEYRKLHNLNKYEPIRNTFTELQLEVVHKLEEYDALLIEVQEIMNPVERMKMCQVYYDKKFKHLLELAA